MSNKITFKQTNEFIRRKMYLKNSLLSTHLEILAADPDKMAAVQVSQGELVEYKTSLYSVISINY